ncbi:MAG: helix-turn-helix transcriptional regulator [Candidatus Margulisbacteria bacterium]|nr:helix-turn-helix transcriptional regulator [Candidatus Margulisiibacteriota bacterium]
MSLGKQIRKARRMANMTQQDLATKVGIVLSSIFNIERGKTDPRWSTVQKIANILNIPLDKIRKSK